MAEVPARRQSELDRLVAPANAVLRAFFRRLPLLAALCAIVWALSGLTVIQGDEVGLLLRNGRLHRAADGSAARPPGLLFALPRPFDEVLRLPIKRVFETELNDLHFAQTEDKRTRYLVSSRMGIDPEQVGYALTGDQNVLHCAMIVRWQIGAPEVYGLQQADPEALLRAAVVSAMVQTLGELPVDTVLSDGRQGLVSRALRRAQVRLDALDSGVALLALELGDLAPPQQVKEEFSEVQSAFINAGTRTREAEEYAALQLPAARAERQRAVQAAEAEANVLRSRARADAAAFAALAAEARDEPGVLRQRIYREKIEATLRDAGAVRFIPPPIGPRYQGLRLELNGAAPAAAP